MGKIPHLYQGHQPGQVGVKLESHLFFQQGLQSPHPCQECSVLSSGLNWELRSPAPENLGHMCAPATNPVTLDHVSLPRYCWHWPTYYRSTVEEKRQCAHPQEESLAYARVGQSRPRWYGTLKSHHWLLHWSHHWSPDAP